MYHTLLVLHLFAAFAVVATVVLFSALAFGWTRDHRVLTVANILWAIGGIGTIVFGIWLSLDVSGYDPFDGWIIAAIVLWAIANELGRRAQVAYTALATPEPATDAAAATAGTATTVTASQAQLWHWLRSVAVLALLVVMIYKPGA